MDCRDVQYKVSEWVDGDLRGTEISEVERHVKICHDCSQIYDDFRILRVASLSVPVVEPSDTVWLNIQDQLVREGISRQKPESGAWRKLLSLSLFPRLNPVFGLAVFLMAVILFGSTVYIYKTRDFWSVAVSHEVEAIRRLQDAELHYQKAIQALDEVSKLRIQSLDPKMAQILNDNLATIDYYVNECQDAAHRSPGNPLIQQYLLAAYQKKAELLQSIVNADAL